MKKQKKITILALESSADETAAAVLEGDKRTRQFKLVSNIIYSQIKLHQITGGIVPEVAARAHIQKIIPVIKLALQKANTELGEIDYIAVTAGPGLVTSLRIGVDTAKALSFALGKPIIPINHMEGHLLSAFGRDNLQLTTYNFPMVGLTVSGGHTQIVLLKDYGRYKILGQTLDDAAGECFDKVAKILGLPYPGGPAISKLAKLGKPIINFPRPMIDAKNYNFSFSGLKTAALYFLRDHPLPAISPRGRGKKGEGASAANIAASLEQAVIDVLVAKTIRAAKEYRAKTALLGGGVSANQKLRQTLTCAMKKELPHSLFLVPHPSLTTDNAGMIAVAAFYHAMFGHVTSYDKVKPDPNWPLKSWR